MTITENTNAIMAVTELLKLNHHPRTQLNENVVALANGALDTLLQTHASMAPVSSMKVKKG